MFGRKNAKNALLFRKDDPLRYLHVPRRQREDLDPPVLPIDDVVINDPGEFVGDDMSKVEE